jgi:hypothetical protein
VLGCDDFGAGGHVEVGLAGVAEPDAVACADFQVNRQVDGMGSVTPRRAVQLRQAVVARTGPRVWLAPKAGRAPARRCGVVLPRRASADSAPIA